MSDPVVYLHMAKLQMDGKVKFAKWQRERCPTTMREHFQMWLVVPSACRITGIKKMLPGCHAEVQHGTDEQAEAYCCKEQSRVSEPQWVCAWGQAADYRWAMENYGNPW